MKAIFVWSVNVGVAAFLAVTVITAHYSTSVTFPAGWLFGVCIANLARAIEHHS